MQNGYGTDPDFGRPSQRSSSSRHDVRNGGSMDGQYGGTSAGSRTPTAGGRPRAPENTPEDAN